MKDKLKIKRHFFDSLKRGTGEAFLIAKDNPEIDFSTYIIKGVLRNYAYDGQCESSRAQYIFDLILLSNNKEKIRKKILQGLATEQDDTWTLTHLFDLAKLYAQNGDKELRQAIYDRFLNNPIEGSDWVGYSEILELDGLYGLLFIAEKYGKWLKENPEEWDDGFIIKDFQDKNPKINVYQELENAAHKKSFIQVYLNCIKKTNEYRTTNERETKTFNNIVDAILQTNHFSYSRTKKLTKQEIIQIAQQLLHEKNRVNQEKLLEIFNIHKFPFDSDFILEFAKQKTTSKYRITEFAIDALKHLSSENIRQFALTRIAETSKPYLYTSILVSNYRDDDSEILTNIARKFQNKYIIENIASSFIDIFEANKTKKCKEPLEEVYNKMNCGIHRKALIETLIKNNVLSDRLREEIKYDSDLETRKLIENE